MAGKSDQMFFQMVTLTPPFSVTLYSASPPVFLPPLTLRRAAPCAAAGWHKVPEGVHDARTLTTAYPNPCGGHVHAACLFPPLTLWRAAPCAAAGKREAPEGVPHFTAAAAAAANPSGKGQSLASVGLSR